MCLAVPGRVLSIAEVDGTTMAEVDFGGVRKNVCLQYVPDAAVGEYVVVHVGFAIQRLDEQSARETLANFARLGLLAAEFGESTEPTEPGEPAGPGESGEAIEPGRAGEPAGGER